MRFRTATLLLTFSFSTLAEETQDASGITDPESGLIMKHGWELVKAHCGGCHSTSLVTQNHMTRPNWVYTIRWMQEKQGLWDLEDAEETIVAYLEENYGIADMPLRRKPLKLNSETP